MFDISLLLDNLLAPPVLFFALGFAAVLFRSDLEIPSPLPKLFSLYLLLAIGFKGGVELRHGGLSPTVLSGIGAGVPWRASCRCARTRCCARGWIRRTRRRSRRRTGR